MARIRTKLRELRDASVHYISLVDRAATRIPFRVLKRDATKETEMSLDLSAVVKREEAPAPAVLALAVFTQPEAVAAQVRQSIADAGFMTTLTRKADEETTLFPQTTSDEEINGQMVRVSDELVVVMKGLPEPTGFLAELAQSQGFLPDLPATLDAFHETIHEIIQKGEEPAPKIAAAVESLQSMLTVMAAIPVRVYKADAAIYQVLRTAADTVMEEEEKLSANENDKEQVQKEAPPAAEPPPPAEKPVEKPPVNVETQEVPGLQPNGGSVVVEKADEVQQQILTLLSSIQATQTELTQKVDGLTTTQAEQKKALDVAVKKAETLEEKLGGTIIAPVVPEDRPSHTEVVKKDDDWRKGPFDTAFPRLRNR